MEKTLISAQSGINVASLFHQHFQWLQVYVIKENTYFVFGFGFGV